MTQCCSLSPRRLGLVLDAALGQGAEASLAWPWVLAGRRSGVRRYFVSVADTVPHELHLSMFHFIMMPRERFCL